MATAMNNVSHIPMCYLIIIIKGHTWTSFIPKFSAGKRWNRSRLGAALSVIANESDDAALRSKQQHIPILF